MQVSHVCLNMSYFFSLISFLCLMNSYDGILNMHSSNMHTHMYFSLQTTTTKSLHWEQWLCRFIQTQPMGKLSLKQLQLVKLSILPIYLRIGKDLVSLYEQTELDLIHKCIKSHNLFVLKGSFFVLTNVFSALSRKVIINLSVLLLFIHTLHNSISVVTQ